MSINENKVTDNSSTLFEIPLNKAIGKYYEA
jgi:hypothetical protein